MVIENKDLFIVVLGTVKMKIFTGQFRLAIYHIEQQNKLKK